jgi:flagellar motility protein MotE (MotC chaperone)
MRRSKKFMMPWAAGVVLGLFMWVEPGLSAETDDKASLGLPAGIQADLLLITGSTQAADKAVTASDYCKSLGPAAGEARLKWQADQLRKLERQVEEATSELEQRRKELQDWISRRDDFIKRANDQLIAIYRTIKPEVAAAQLSELDDETASAILLKLDARIASRIFDELAGPRAARLVTLISGASAFSSSPDGQNE